MTPGMIGSHMDEAPLSSMSSFAKAIADGFGSCDCTPLENPITASASRAAPVERAKAMALIHSAPAGIRRSASLDDANAPRSSNDGCLCKSDEKPVLDDARY